MPYHTINDIQLYYEWHGPEDAFPLVCINGLLSDTTSWGLQVPAFSQAFRVLLYDCRGQGRSDKPPGPYPQAIHVADLIGLLDALNIPQAHLVGLSNGGTVAMCFTLDYPERVARLVLIDTFAHMDPVMQQKLHTWLLALDLGGSVARFDVAHPWVWGQRFIAKRPDMLAAMREKAHAADPQAIRGMIEGTMEYDIRHRLSAIAAPTLVLVGAEDVLTPPWFSHELATHIPDARLITVPDAGHALTVEAPGVVNALALSFLRNEF